MAAPKSVAIISASTRTPRVGPEVAAFVKDILDKETLSTPAGSSIALHLVDLASFKLPVFDEKVIPGMVKEPEDYKHEHSRAWSRGIKKHDAYVLVIPEYNCTCSLIPGTAPFPCRPW